ncbi:MAG: DUF2905 domain-containing protein [Thermodesulfobacteriaceae bacterium]|jgi:hypothetical protein
MNGFNEMGKFLILLGVLLVALGLLINFFPKIPYLGKLPGDIHIKRDNFEFFFPLGTSILLSIILTIILNLIFRR